MKEWNDKKINELLNYENYCFLRRLSISSICCSLPGWVQFKRIEAEGRMTEMGEIGGGAPRGITANRG